MPVSINELAIAENKRRALQPAAQSGDQATEGDQTKVSVHIIIPTNRQAEYTTVNHPRIFALTIVPYAPLPLYQPPKSISFLPDILSFGITGELRHEKKLIGSKVSSVAGGRRKHTGPSMSSSPTRWSGNSTLIMAQTTISSNLGNTCARSYVAVPRSPIQLRDVKRYEPAMTI